nr:HupE/UreJ family protein [Acinetobacter sp. Marseille-Q1620]
MQKIIQTIIFACLAFMPAWVFAHPGHDHSHVGFEAGFLHPFTGLDHMMMALALGVLFYSAVKQWKLVGVLVMSIALVSGFAIGVEHLIPENFAEYGIGLSLLAVAVALWSKSKVILPVATALLVTFHGVAHGAELGQSGHLIGLVAGMLTAMVMIYIVGLGFGKFIVDHIPYGKKIVGALAAFIALVGLA